jgi:hypothetical protein
MPGTSFPFSFPSPFGSGFSFVPPIGGTPIGGSFINPPSRESNGIDRLIDPVTLDYVRTEDGQWAETADNRTSVLIAFSIALGSSPFDPDHGSQIADRLKDGGLTPEFLRAESVRIGEQLARAGILSDFQVTVRGPDKEPIRDQAGNLSVLLRWRDLSSGSPATTAFTPR